MNKFATAALAATLALGTVGVAGAAEAQSRRDAREWRQDQREDRRELRQDRREFRQDQRQDRREFRQEVRQYERWQRAQRRYSAPRYVPPRGYYARSWGYGQALPPAYRGRQYVVYDYNRYGLRAPPRGYHYVRTGDDVVLAAVATGVITAVIAGLFN